MWLAVLVSTALGCAGLVHEEGALAESGASETVFELFDGETEVTYEVVYEGDADAFGWIVPVPGEVLSVSDGDADWLEALRSASSPEVYREEPYEEETRGCFRSGASKGDGANLAGGGTQDVVILGEGFTGTYDYVVVEATDAAALTAWAEEGGWSIAGVSVDLQHYIDLGHPLVLLDLHPDSGETDGLRSLPPVTIRYGSEELRFPSMMARSGGMAQRSTIYVLGETRAEVADGWSFEDVSELNGPGEAADLFEERLMELGADRTWARTWSGQAEGRFLTRFDLYAEAVVHDRDAIFDFDGTTYEERLSIYLWDASGQAWLLLPLALGSVAARRRRRT